MKTRKGMLGQQHGRLLVIGHEFKIGERWKVVCRCDCGKVTVVDVSKVGSQTKSCGCLRLEANTRHGRSHTKLYRVHLGMKQRCENPNARSWKNYGGKGVRVCDEWQEFESFYRWAAGSGYREGLTIDRIDPMGNYEPANCRWVTRRENAWLSNGGKLTPSKVRAIRRMLQDGVKQRVICEKFGIGRRTVYRIKTRSQWADVS